MNEKALSVVVKAATSVDLQKSRIPPDARFAGFVESIDGWAVRGWAFALDEPSAPVVLTARLGGQVIAVGETMIGRQDVVDALRGSVPAGMPEAPGFELRLQPGLVARALSGRGSLALTVDIVTGQTAHRLAHAIRPQRAARWASVIGAGEAQGSAADPVLPVFEGHWLATQHDLTQAVPEDLAREIAAAPMFDAAHYARQAEAMRLWLSAGLTRADDLLRARHFAAIGSRFGVVPRDGLVFDAEYFRATYNVPAGEAPLLTFVRRCFAPGAMFPNPMAEAELRRQALTEAAGHEGSPPAAPAAPASGQGAAPEPEAEARRREVEILGRELLPLDEAAVTRAMETLRRTGGFDTQYYLSRYRDVAQSGADPLYHYVRHGEREGRRPNPWFDPDHYFTIYEDVRRHVPNALAHYMEFGRAEGRSAMPADRGRFVTGKPLLFVAHSGLRAGAERVLLEIVKWTAQHTTRSITVYFLSGGPLVSEFAQHARVVTAAQTEALDLELRQALIEEDWGFVYLNTVIGGRFLRGLDPDRLEKLAIIGHIHELEAVLKEHEADLSPLLEHADYLISASPASSAHLASHYGVPEDRLDTIEAFVRPQLPESEDPAEWRKAARRELGLDERDLVVMGCGSVYWRKGPDIFLEVALRLMKGRDASETDERLKFVWLGGGEDLPAMRAAAAKAGLEDRIRFLGESDHASTLLAAGDLFFLSSREDPFPLVVMEAAQFGAPSVHIAGTTGIGSFTGEEGGYVVEGTDPAALAPQMAAILADRNEIARRGAAARARVYAGYTAERQCEVIYHKARERAGLAPLVSVIVPNYNHAPYLPERIGSIREQGLKDFELIVLDDGSSDDSLAVIEAEIADMPNARLIPNEANTGEVFSQWQKGLAAARAPHVWIAESDDRAAPDFLQRLAPLISRPGVAIASGRTIPFTAKGPDPKPMQQYLDSQCPGLFDEPFLMDGDRFVRLGMGAACLLVNASGLLFDAGALRASVPRGKSYSMAGDWAIYLDILRRGKIAYDPEAINEFRRHPNSRVHKVEGTPLYFEERRRIAEQVYDSFAVNQSLHDRIASTLRHELERFADRSPGITLADVVPPNARVSRRAGPRVALYVHGMLFSRGGIERLAAQMSRAMAAAGYEMHIICRTWGRKEPVYALHDSVRVAPIFDETREEASIAAVHRYLVENEIDVFVPMLSEWLFAPVMEAGRRAGVRMVASEHNDPWKIEELWWSREARHETFELADRIHLLSSAFIPSLPPHLQERAVVIPNGVDVDRFSVGPQDRPKVIVAAGRLFPQKRFDLLIEAFHRSRLAADGWSLRIYGEGAEQDALAARIEALGLAGSARLMGRADEMVSVYANAAFTVLPSDFEGFGLVVVESLATGTPVIAFADCNGPNEILHDGVEGLLIRPGDDRASALAAGMRQLADNPTLLRDMSAAGPKRALDFSLSKFEENWETLLGGLVR